MAPFCTLKLILIGESGVGKTSLLSRFVSGVFMNTRHVQTVIDLKVQTIQIFGKLVKLEIWDTAGQERFRAVSREYYRNCDGVVLMYDVTEIETYYKTSSWLSEIRKYTDGVTILVGNKNEDPKSRTVQATVVSSYAKEEGLEFIEISVKTGYNVEKVFQILVRKIMELKYPALLESYNVTKTPNTTVTSATAEVSASDNTDAAVLTVTKTPNSITPAKTEETANNDDLIRLSDTPPVTRRNSCSC